MEKKRLEKPVFYGGQALLEGVMMKGTKCCACAVRGEDGEIKKTVSEVSSIKDKFKFLGLPVIRGVVNFIEMMFLAFKTLGYSAEVAGTLEEEEQPGRVETFLTKFFGVSMMKIVMGIAVCLGLALAVFLFMFLPAKTVQLGSGFLPAWSLTIVEGLIKIVFFVLYIFLVSRMKEIKRTFEYHGAEHKTIFCYENEQELTVENVKKFPKEHPRCGTSFMILVLIVSILVFSFITWSNIWVRVALKILLLPLTMGLAYELIRFAGKHDNAITRIVSAPGKWLQKLTTSEPDAGEIECAITALKLVLDNEGVESYPEVREGTTEGFEILKDDSGAENAATNSTEAVNNTESIEKSEGDSEETQG